MIRTHKLQKSCSVSIVEKHFPVKNLHCNSSMEYLVIMAEERKILFYNMKKQVIRKMV